MTIIGEGMEYTQRIDVGGFDLDAAGMTQDAAWHDWDLSGIVPKGTKAVMIYGTLSDNAVNSVLYFRIKGDTTASNRVTFRTQTADSVLGVNFIIGVDANYIIQYNAAAVTFTGIGLKVVGWFK